MEKRLQKVILKKPPFEMGGVNKAPMLGKVKRNTEDKENNA